MAAPTLDIEEWDLVIDKLARHHDNIQTEIAQLIDTIRKEMKSELVPVAEEKAAYGKKIKGTIRSMWALEYEIEDLQKEFEKAIGGIDINNLTDDFVEDVMLQSKPLQSVLKEIRTRQKVRMEEIKKEYGDHVKDLEPLYIVRPPNEEVKKKTGKAVPEGDKKPADAAPAPAPASEPAPAVDPAAAPAPTPVSA